MIITIIIIMGNMWVTVVPVVLANLEERLKKMEKRVRSETIQITILVIRERLTIR